MTTSKLSSLPGSWMKTPWSKPGGLPIETLVAFVRDAEHEMLSVATALQAQIDLIEREQKDNIVSTTRFPTLNRVIARLVSDAAILLSVSELTMLPRLNTKQNVETLMSEIVFETKAECMANEVSLHCNIASDIHVCGSTEAIKLMFKETVLALLLESEKLETIRISGRAGKKNVSLSFDNGTRNKERKFQHWRLGKLRLLPVNGEGITLAAIDAVARLHSGRLSVKALPNRRHEYRLNFAG